MMVNAISSERDRSVSGAAVMYLLALTLLIWGCGARSITEPTCPPAHAAGAPAEDAEPAPALEPPEPSVHASASGVSGIAHRADAEEPGTDEPDVRRATSSDTSAGPFAVATRDPRATRVAFDVLQDGGTAADAAFAAGMVLSVVEPHFSHALGGGTWALYYDAARDRVRALDGVGPTGSQVDISFFQDPQRNTPYGGHRVIVPGAWDAWMVLLRDHGAMHLDGLMEPAIRLAREGAAASRSMVGFILQERCNILTMPDTAAVFLPGGRAPKIGDVVVQSDLACTLQSIADTYRAAFDREAGSSADRRTAGIQAARDYYYRGPIARELVCFLQANNGFLTAEDFASFRAQWREPIFTRYKDRTVYGCPPNSQGVSMLMALNILENFDLAAGPDDPDVVHAIAEATKLAKIDTWHYVAAPEAMCVDVERLLSKDYARRQADRIAADAVIRWPAEGGLCLNEENNTTTFSVVDGEGNALALTTSTGAQFLVGGRTGILLNQRMAIMAIAEENPNCIAPCKKVRHTVNPYMAFRDGRFSMAGGNTGFDTQPQGQIQQFLNIVEFSMSPQEAVARPRFITHAFPASHYPHRATNELFLEAGFPDELVRSLADRGHVMGRSAIIGNGNVIVSDPSTGELATGADPRGENLGLTGREQVGMVKPGH